jgi:alpha-beta hydrolase superfamily lysophospholipase
MLCKCYIDRVRIHLLILTLLSATQLLGACATPYVHPQSNGQSVPVLDNTHAVMEDGYRLPLRWWRAPGNSHAVVLALHGMNDYSNSFASTGEYLAERGVSLVAYDQRGFGGTQGQGYWHGSQRLTKDVRIMAGLLRERFPDQPLYLLGESMGGAAALASLNAQPTEVDGVILVAPAVWSRSDMPFYQRFALWLAAHTVPGKQLTGEGLDIIPSDNTAMLRALGRDPLVIKETRVDVLYGVSNLMDEATAASLDTDTETLILYGRNDQIIPKQPTCRWLQSLPDGPRKRWRAVFYENGYHMLTRDLQARVVLGDIANWLPGTGEATSGAGYKPGQQPVATFCTH